MKIKGFKAWRPDETFVKVQFDEEEYDASSVYQKEILKVF